MIENILKIKFLKMASGGLGVVPGPFGSILDMVAAWKRLQFRKNQILGGPCGAP